ncbi:hypothetical protein ACHAXS_002677 [Conticribra weissflogii]
MTMKKFRCLTSTAITTILYHHYYIFGVASSLVRFASSLSLQDYIGKQILVGDGASNGNNGNTVVLDDGLFADGLVEESPGDTTTTSTATATTTAAASATDACSASDATSTIDCPFYSPYMEGATLYSQLVPTSCDNLTSVDIHDDTTAVQAEGEDVVIASGDYPRVIVDNDDDQTITADWNNSTTTTTTTKYCARAELHDDVAALAVMTITIELTLTFHYGANGTFAIDTIRAQVLDPAGAPIDVQASRSAYVRARYGRCDDAAPPEKRLGLGDVLAVCAYVDDDSDGGSGDVEIGGIRYVTLKDGGSGSGSGSGGGGAILAMPVDEDNKANFVTVLTPDVNVDGNSDGSSSSTTSSKSVTIETLLTPKVFDGRVGTSIVVSGVADLKYVDIDVDGGTDRRRRRLQVGSGRPMPAREFFNVVVDIEKEKRLPKVAQGPGMDETANGAAAAFGGGLGGGIWRWTWTWRRRRQEMRTFCCGMSDVLFRLLLPSAVAMAAAVV